MKKFLAIVLVSTALPALAKPAEANPAMVQAAIGACTANPYACAVIGAVAGNWILWENAPKVFCTAGGCQARKMLNDPEKEEYITDEEPILADSLQEAQRKCRELANARGLQLQGIKEPSRRGGKRYVCKFGGYVEK